MDCRQFEFWAKGDLSDDLFALHRKSCDSCQKAFLSDQKLMNTALNLNKNLPVPDQWPAIEKKLDRVDRQKRSFKLVRYSLMAAALLFIFTIFYFPWSKPIDISQDRILDEKALLYVQETEEAYLKALESLQDRAENRLQSSDEQLATLYRQKLDLVDQQITRCRDALDQNPANAHIRRYLLAALETKQNTLIDIIENM